MSLLGPTVRKNDYFAHLSYSGASKGEQDSVPPKELRACLGFLSLHFFLYFFLYKRFQPDTNFLVMILLLVSDS